jgi:hypothetical protein
MKTYLVVLCMIITGYSHAQFSQQGSKLFGTGSSGSTPEQGSSVALSFDGNTAIVGGWDDNGAIGAAWIFIRSGGHWTQQGSKLVGTGTAGSLGSYQGFSVALSADGNTAIVGGYMDNDRVGAAWIFTRSGGVWSQQGSKLVGNDYVISGAPASYQGWSVGLSADGNTAIVGGYYDNNRVGAAWIYKRTGGVWAQVGSKLVGNDYSGNSQQGYSAAISGDGKTAIVGGNNDAPFYGSAWIYVLKDTVWKQQRIKLTLGNNSAFGSSVAISSNGNTVIVGGPSDYNYGYIGAVWIYARSVIDSSWNLKANGLLATGYTGSPQFGTSVSLSSDGGWAIVGAQANDSYAGAAWVLKRSTIDSTWSQQGSKLFGTDTSGKARQGYAVAISGDGNTALISGYADGTFAGATWVFATPSAPLPVELISFTAAAANSSTTLVWKTATEVNNYGFEIERSDFAFPQTVGSWEKIGFVAAMGSSAKPHDYSYTDVDLPSGRYEYRLKQISADGSIKYSSVAEAEIGISPSVFALGQNYPNPFNPSTTIRFSLARRGQVSLKILDILGREVATLVNGDLEAGLHQATFDASRFASGIYLYRVKAGDFSATKKLVLIK